MTDSPDHVSPKQKPADASPSRPPVFGRVDDVAAERRRQPWSMMPLREALANMTSTVVARQALEQGQAAQIAKTMQLASDSLIRNATLAEKNWLGIGRAIEGAAASGVLGVQGHQRALLDAASVGTKARQTLLDATASAAGGRAFLGLVEDVRSARLGAAGVVAAQHALDQSAVSMVRGVQGHRSALLDAVSGGAAKMRAMQQAQLGAAGAVAGGPWSRLQDQLMVSPAVTGQLGFSGLQAMVDRAFDGMRSFGAVGWSSRLADTEVRIQRALNEAEDTSFALFADAMEAQQAAMRGDHEAVIRFARRWMRRMPKSWLMREPQSGDTSALATALILTDLDEYSSDGAFDLLDVLPKRTRAVRRDECCLFDREVGDSLLGSIEARAEVAGLGRDELRPSGQDVENEALAFLAGPENGGFDDSRMIALASTLSLEEMMLLMARANRPDWKQAAADCGMSVKQGNRARDRIRYRVKQIRDGFNGYSFTTSRDKSR